MQLTTYPGADRSRWREAALRDRRLADGRAGKAPAAVINEFTDLRWITIEGPQHYPF